MSETTFEPGTKVCWEDSDTWYHYGVVKRVFDLDDGLPYAIVMEEFSVQEVTVAVSALSKDPYIAETGDWVRMADGAAATVIKASIAYRPRDEQSGCVYTLLFKGGMEVAYYHWADADHLVRANLGDRTEPFPLFTVVSQEA